MSPDTSFCAPAEASSILAVILEHSDDAVLRIDLDGVVAGWSRGASRLYGYTVGEMVGSSVGVLVPEDRWEEFVQLLDQIRAGRTVNRRSTIRRAKDGRIVNVELSILPIADAIGQPVSAVSIARDITALTQAESATRASGARWRAIFDSAVDGVIVIDGKGTIESFNAAAERLFGYRVEEALGRSVNMLMPSPYRDEHDDYLARYLAGGPAKIIGIGRAITARRRNGEEFPARLAVGEAFVDGEVRFTGIVHDLTERVRIETQLREQTALAKLGEMTAVVAHEFGNALAAVRGAVQVIGTRLPAESRDTSLIRDIVGRVDALTKIVKDMLLFARLPEPQQIPVDVQQLVTAAASITRHDPAFQAVMVELIGTVPVIRGDPDLLKVVFQNIFTNSAQAMHGTGTIRVRLEATESACHIVIADNGPGVPLEVRERLFTPFCTTKARGSGLGLATARRIIDAHGGRISAEWPPNGGTTILIEVPIQR